MSMQVTKVWWDGEKLMAEPIPESEIYKESAQQDPVAVVASHPERIDWLRDEPPDGTLLYTFPPARKPLTHEQRLEVLTRFKKYDIDWDGPAILIDLVEAAHGIKDDA